MVKKIGVGILGGTGYGAGELLRLLASHPDAAVVSVVSSSQAGTAVATSHPHIAGFYDSLLFDAELDPSRFSEYPDRILFAALPHGKSAESLSALLARPELEGFRIVDLSGDFRLKNIAERDRHYPEARVGDGVASEFVYGLTERNRSRIAKARCVANPGCLSSACALAVLPLVDEKFRGAIAFDAKTGSSGAGKTASDSFHHPFRHANANAYKVLEHRHEPEIREALGDVAGERIETAFVPHVIPVSRGILASAYLTLERAETTESLRARYRSFYADSPFVRVRDGAPDLQSVVGSNFCDISIFSRGRQAVAFAALDNLVKGMAGQAIQNMNVLFGLPETTGLWTPAPGLI